MADAGIEDILIPTTCSARRSCAASPTCCGAHGSPSRRTMKRCFPGLAAAAADAGVELEVHVECDTGLERAGVQTPEQAAGLARTIEPRKGCGSADSSRIRRSRLRFPSSGGGSHRRRARPRRPVRFSRRDPRHVVGGRACPDGDGVPRGHVRLPRSHDRGRGRRGLDDVALTVLATVVSRPTDDRAIVDAGSKALAYDPGPDDGRGLILEARAVRDREGHRGARSRAPLGRDRLELGQRVRIVPNHVCVVSNLFDEVWVARDEEVVDRWPVAARGRSR